MREKTGTIGAVAGMAVFGVVTALLILAMLPGVAVANEDPVGGCSPGTTNDGPDPEANGWSLESVESMIDQDVGNKLDQNGDGYVCQRFVYGLRLKYGDYDSPPAPVLGDCCGYWSVKDNTNPLRDR